LFRAFVSSQSESIKTVSVYLQGKRLSPSECDALAKHDGFDSFTEMMRFWEGRLPFAGQVYHWRKMPDTT
jgi:hypothetical protein